MAYDRPPAWRYFPPTDPPPQPLQQVADAMAKLGEWFKDDFWPGAATSGRIDSKLISKQLEDYLPSAPAGVRLEGGLLRGWNVETRDSVERIPLLYGEDGKSVYGVNPDAIYAGDEGYRALLEIEGGGAVENNRLMKDVVETLLIPGAHQPCARCPAPHSRPIPVRFRRQPDLGPLRARGRATARPRDTRGRVLAARSAA